MMHGKFWKIHIEQLTDNSVFYMFSMRFTLLKFKYCVLEKGFSGNLIKTQQRRSLTETNFFLTLCAVGKDAVCGTHELG